MRNDARPGMYVYHLRYIGRVSGIPGRPIAGAANRTKHRMKRNVPKTGGGRGGASIPRFLLTSTRLKPRDSVPSGHRTKSTRAMAKDRRKKALGAVRFD